MSGKIFSDVRMSMKEAIRPYIKSTFFLLRRSPLVWLSNFSVLTYFYILLVVDKLSAPKESFTYMFYLAVGRFLVVPIVSSTYTNFMMQFYSLKFKDKQKCVIIPSFWMIGECIAPYRLGMVSIDPNESLCTVSFPDGRELTSSFQKMSFNELMINFDGKKLYLKLL